MTEDSISARGLFPRGLDQPTEGYRFSFDSLLLAAFAPAGRRILDLGAGCGVVGLTILLHRIDSESRIVGLERTPVLADCAERNAISLGFGSRYDLIRGRVEDLPGARWFDAGSFDGAVMNPPFRSPGSGRVSEREEVRSARFAGGGVLKAFVQGAAWAVRTGGWAAVVFPAERLSELLVLLTGVGLEPKRLVMVHPRRREPARLVLVEARRNGSPGLIIEPPLVLHVGRGAKTRLTRQVLRFCPHLSCNQGLSKNDLNG
ncbi:MAG: methyltransferase [Deltaproteobacteria bacterium]|nr:methyltransferase [Deltaproteobacteria bacterium]